LTVDPARIFGLLPSSLLARMLAAARQEGMTLYLCGGAVRDLVMGRDPADLDFTVERAAPLARRLAAELPATLVALDEDEDAWRLVWRGVDLDFTGLRRPARDIGADLKLRDFTLNAMAVEVDDAFAAGERRPLIDPTGGVADIAAGRIRMLSPAVLDADPLRRLRAFRFAACLGFAIDSATLAAIAAGRGTLAAVAAERIAAELDHLIASGRGAGEMTAMRDSGILAEVLPELARGAGMEQPASHHLDVLDHGVAALAAADGIAAGPEAWFGRDAEEIRVWLGRGRNREKLRWAALLHDLGKPLCREIRNGRITFYDHDRVGAEEVARLARRLRWSRRRREAVARLVRLHMWPFHLNNALRKTGIKPRACLKLYRAAGDDLPGLFLLSMADSLAGRGPERPENMEEAIAALYKRIAMVVRERIKPARSAPPLLTGNDLKAMGIPPGPIYRKILGAIEEARVAGEVETSAEAAAYVERFLASSVF